ncbi:MAG TPA: hypothetical protein VN150_03080, partial [Ochrobactrum sp.]|nr:hypothetical protein [Ochrobactrum sp.]
RALQISPLRTPPPSEAGFLVFRTAFSFINFTDRGDPVSLALCLNFSHSLPVISRKTASHE